MAHTNPRQQFYGVPGSDRPRQREFIDAQRHMMSHGGMLKTTHLTNDAIADMRLGWEPVDYIVIPPQHHQIGKIVIPFAAVGNNGVLNETVRPFYAVTQRPSEMAEMKDVAVARTREAHVLAEDAALRTGVFAVHGRSIAEYRAADLVIPAARAAYIADRLAHIKALEVEFDDALSGHRLDMAMTGLTNATEALELLASQQE
ncbi:hypothetical protein KDA23_03050 [Candidatus Saccharibacteria bacterium]|nr:hypothetical protein [Candidatus Saccharibacteria bacterium]